MHVVVARRAWFVMGLLALGWLAAAPACVGKQPCSEAQPCADGLFCADDGDGGGVCSRGCAPDLSCPAGEACVPRDDGSFEGVCLAVDGDADAGDPCSDDLECTSGACLGGDAPICVDTCDAGGTCRNAADRCTLDGLRYVCVPPLDDRAAGEACSSPRECLSGTCVVRPGDDVALCADICSDELACADDLVCVRLTGGARACLDALADGADCQADTACRGGFCIEDVDAKQKCASGCVDGACADGFACESDQDGNRVCLPVLDDRASGETCERARECASGHCARFFDPSATPPLDRTLCADPCAAGECAAGLVCWTAEDPQGVDLCGPTP